MFRRRHPVVQKPSSKQQRIWFYLVLPPFTKKACLKIFFFRGREISQRLYNIYSRACCKAPRSWISCWFSAFPSNPSREFMRFLKKIKIVQIYITRLAPNFFYTIKTFSVCLKTIKKILRFLNIFHRILIFFMKIEFDGRHFILEILIIHWPFLGLCEVLHKTWAQSVQPCWRLLDTNKQTDK